MDDALYDVGQRLDALAADDERAYLHQPAHRHETDDHHHHHHRPYLVPVVPAATTSATARRSSALPSSQRVQYPHHSRRGSQGELHAPAHQQHHHHRSRRRRWHWRRWLPLPLLSWATGLSAFYLRLVLVMALGWALATASVVVTATLSLRGSVLRAVEAALPANLDLARAMALAHQHGVTLDSSSSLAAFVLTWPWPWTLLARELALQSLGVALGCALLGSLADHYGRRRLLLVATAWWLVAHLGAAFAGSSSSSSLLLARFLEGIGLGGQFVLFYVLPAECGAQRQRGRLATLGLVGIAVGTEAGLHGALPLLDAVGGDPRVVHAAVIGGAGLGYLLLLLRVLHDSPRFLAATGRVDAARRRVDVIERAHGVQRILPTSPARSSLTWQPHASARATATATATATGALAPGMVSVFVSLRRRWQRVLCRPPYRARSLTLAVFWFVAWATLTLAVAATARFADHHAVLTFSVAAGAACLGHTATAAFVDRRGRVGMLTGSLVVAALGVALTALYFQLLLQRDEENEVESEYDVKMTASATLAELLAAAFAAEPPSGAGSSASSSSSSSTSGAGAGWNQPRPVVSVQALGVVASAVLFGAASTTLATGAVWTLEHYGVLIRATGVGHAMATGWLGVGGALWLVWSTDDAPASTAVDGSGRTVARKPPYAWLAVNMTGEGATIATWVAAGSLLGLAAWAWARGLDTSGSDDCDHVISDNGVHSHGHTGSIPMGPPYNYEAAHPDSSHHHRYRRHHQPRSKRGSRFQGGLDTFGTTTTHVAYSGTMSSSVGSLSLGAADTEVLNADLDIQWDDHARESLSGGRSLSWMAAESPSARYEAWYATHSLREQRLHRTASSISSASSSPPLGSRRWEMSPDNLHAATHDMLTIDTDPFEHDDNDDERNASFVPVGSPVRPLRNVAVLGGEGSSRGKSRR